MANGEREELEEPSRLDTRERPCTGSTKVCVDSLAVTLYTGGLDCSLGVGMAVRPDPGVSLGVLSLSPCGT